MAPQPYFDDHGHVLPFDLLMQLEKIDDRTFRSVTQAFSPTDGETLGFGAFGGHVYAQAAWAAAQTIKEGFLIHNITGWFTIGGHPSEHFVYTVHTVRDGYNYCTRTVTVTQADERGTMFTCTCSFKREEASSLEYQEKLDVKKAYKDVLAGKENEPMEHPATPDQDSEEFRESYLPKHPEHFNPIPGLHLRKVEMQKYNHDKAPSDRRQLIFYTLRGTLPLPTVPYPPPTTAPFSVKAANLHACAHLYASDHNSLFLIPNHLGRGRDFTRMASIAHTVIFHTGIKDLIMTPEPRIHSQHAHPTAFQDESLTLCDTNGDQTSDTDGRKWFVQESWFSRAGSGRGLHHSRIYDYATGKHVATSMQDGLIRFKSGTRL